MSEKTQTVVGSNPWLLSAAMVCARVDYHTCIDEVCMNINGPRTRPFLATLCLSLMLPASGLYADSDREQKQAELDAACEAAREKKLAPL
ncbi:MAG TPA: hypothetical protein VFG52_10000, partial [Xanthomonadales bacterium]|nr:hypothetical protein [Xanthomonadales bacterium]